MLECNFVPTTSLPLVTTWRHDYLQMRKVACSFLSCWLTFVGVLFHATFLYSYVLNKNTHVCHSNILSRLNVLVPIKQITDNKKSSFEYEFTEKFEAGLMLTGTEVKSCRKGMVQLSDSMAEIIDGECWLLNCHIGMTILWNQKNLLLIMLYINLHHDITTISDWSLNNAILAEHDRCGRLDQHKPKRSRKLLLNKKEVNFKWLAIWSERVDQIIMGCILISEARCKILFL